jgi:hypothetical protein
MSCLHVQYSIIHQAHHHITSAFRLHSLLRMQGLHLHAEALKDGGHLLHNLEGMLLISDWHAVNISVERPEVSLLKLHLPSDGLKEEKEGGGTVVGEAELLLVHAEVHGDLGIPPPTHAQFAAESEI